MRAIGCDADRVPIYSRAMQKRVRGAVGVFEAFLMAVTLLTACSDESSRAPTLDASLEAAGPTSDSAASETGRLDSGPMPDARTDASAMTDAAVDASAMTNASSWIASAGLPSAACTAWTLVDTSAAKDPVIGGGLMTLATDANTENMYWRQDAADLITPATLVLEFQLRMIAGSSSNTTRAPSNVVIRYGAPLRTAALHIGTTEAFLTSADLTKGQSATVATTDALHTYRVSIDTASHAITVSRDGSPIVTGTAYVELDGAATKSIYFGEASNLATGSSMWGSVTHNAHALTPCP